MSGTVNKVNEVLLLLGFFSIGSSSVHREVKRDCTAFHRDASRLFIRSGVEVANLACHFGGYDAIGGDEGVGEGGLAMVNVSEDADVANVGRVGVEGRQG